MSSVMLNVSEDLLLYFVAHCQSVLKLKYSTIKLYLAGIRFYGINSYGVNPLCDKNGNNLVRLDNMLMGIKKFDTKPINRSYQLQLTYCVKYISV